MRVLVEQSSRAEIMYSDLYKGLKLKPDAVKEEMVKLRCPRAIKEVFYLKWLANMLVVKKKNEKWQVCVDFTELNKTCPKDPFAILQIDQLVDATVGYP